MVAHCSPIPRTFHRIWLGDEMPEEFRKYGETFSRLHPDWEMKLWTEANLPALRNQREFDAAETFAQKADILRYELLFEHGGVYIDTDFECLKPLDALLEGVTAFSASEDTQWISTGIMGSVPRHALFSALIEELPRALASSPNAPVNEQTGPVFFTRVATGRRLKNLDQDFVVYPPSHFFPYRVGEEHLRANGFPHAYAVHHWAGSWLKKNSPAVSNDSAPRILLGFDPEAPQAALSILEAYQNLFAPGDEIELAVYAYAEPSLPLLDCIQQLVRVLVGHPDQMAPLALLSRSELSDVAYQAAYFPSGDELKDARATAHTIQALCALRAQLKGAEALSLRLPPRPPRNEILSRAAKQPQRSSQALSVPTTQSLTQEQTAQSKAESVPRINAPMIYGASLGNGRVLIHTTRGTPLLAHAEDLSLTPELLMHGEYDGPLTHFLSKRLALGHVAFDIGANIGLFTVQMAQQVGPGGHVVAYEALPHNYQLLQDNIGMNYQSQHCTLLREAAWRGRESLKFKAPSQFLGNGSLVLNEGDYGQRYPGDRLNEIQVQAVPVSEQLDKFKKVELIKIDVEGAEYQVFAGMNAALTSGKVRCVVFECVRSFMADDWEPFVALLSKLQAQHGAEYSTIKRDGSLVPLPLQSLIAQGHFTQVVMQLGN